MTQSQRQERFRFGPALAATVATVLVFWFFRQAASVFLLLFMAIILSLYLGAVRDWIVRRLRLPQHLAFLLAVVLTIGGIVGLVALLIPPIAEQMRELVRVMPQYIDGWEAALRRFVARNPALRNVYQPGDIQLLGALRPQLEGLAGGLVPRVFSIAHAIVNTFAILVMSVFMALQPALYREWLIALFPPVKRDLVRDVLGDLANTLRSWIVAQSFAMFTLGMLTAIGLYFLKVPYWLTFGVFVGVVVIIPFFGTLFGTLFPALFVLGGPGFAGYGPGTHALFVLLLGVVVHFVEGNVIVPLITAKKVEIPPVLSIMAVLVVGTLGGGVALLVAVPMLACLMVIIRRVVIGRIYEGQAFRRVSRDRVLVLRVPAPDGGVLTSGDPPIDVLEFTPPIRKSA